MLACRPNILKCFLDLLFYDGQSLAPCVCQNILKCPWEIKCVWPTFQKRHMYYFSFHSFNQFSEKPPPFTRKNKQKADQNTVFPQANKTYLKQTTLAATATFLKLLLQHLWEGFFSQLIWVWCLSWSVSSCVKRHNLWTLKPEFYFSLEEHREQWTEYDRNMHLPETQGQAFIFSPQQIAYWKCGTTQEAAL